MKLVWASVQCVTAPRIDARVTTMQPSSRYLHLLKKVLTDTVDHEEPNPDRPEVVYLRDFIEHFRRGRAYTMVPAARLDSLEACLRDVVASGVPGDVLEAGVWRGGACIFMRAALLELDAADRKVFVADSFEGLPKPDAAKFPREAKAHESAAMKDVFHHFAASLEEVQANFARFDLLDEQVRFLKGWFSETLTREPISRLAVLRLDADYYDSTIDVLTALYDKVSSGGYVIVDDYGEDQWTYCRRAVDDFRRERGIAAPMQRVDRKCYFWKREI